MKPSDIARVVFKSAVVGVVTVLTAVLVAIFVGAPILTLFLSKRTSNLQGEVEVAWDLRALLNHYLGPTWTAALFLVIFACGFAWAEVHTVMSAPKVGSSK